MKKDIEWLKERVSSRKKSAELNVMAHREGLSEDFESRVIAYESVLKLINQLDEPEVLSQEWIDENEVFIFDLDDDCEIRYVPSLKLQNLLVPILSKKKKVQLSQKTGDELNRYKELGYSLKDLLVIAGSKQAQEKLARAWLDGFTVEEEQKYQVIIRDGEYIRLYLCKHGGNVTIGTNNNYIEKCPEVTYLTEQEIKDYDERYWPFAVKVEELEEC